MPSYTCECYVIAISLAMTRSAILIPGWRRDAEDTDWVYDWRLQQEQTLKAEKGRGMTDKGVIEFVNACESDRCPFE